MSNTHIAVSLVVLIAGIFCQGDRAIGGSSSVHSGNAGNILDRENVGSTTFILRRTRNRRVSIDIYVNGGKWASTVDQGAGSGGGEDGVGYEFWLSPNRHYLFVTKKLAHGVGVAYLYGDRHNGKMDPIRPHHLRFDEAALAFYLKKRGIHDKRIGPNARNIRMIER